MNRLASLVGGVLLCSSLFATALPAAAQPGGACPLISDDMLTEALGSPTHAMGFLSNPNTPGDTGPTVADMCFAQLAGGQNGLILTHMVGVQSSDLNNALAVSQGPRTLNVGGGGVDAAALTVTPIRGVGDNAVLLTGSSADHSYANLLVWRGTDAFSIAGTGLTDPQTSLSGVAQAILAGH